MAKQREIVAYHNLGRQELQKLCKKYGLAANKSNARMADALASLLKREKLNEEYLDDTNAAVQASSPISDAITVDEGKQSADSDCMNRENMENIVPEERVLNRTAKNIGVSYVSENQMEDSFTVDTVFVSSRADHDDFQFFVECEEGISLYVDLNSSPVHWMKAQNYESFIPRQIHDHRLHEQTPRPIARKHRGISQETTADRKLGLQSQVLKSENACNHNSKLTVSCANFYPTQNYSPGGSQRPGLYNRTGEAASTTPCIFTKNLEAFSDPRHTSSVLKAPPGEAVCSSSVVHHNASSFSSSVISHGGDNGFSPSSAVAGSDKPQVEQNKETQIQRGFQAHCSQDKIQNAKHCSNAILEAFQEQEQRDISRHKDVYRMIPVAKNLRTMKILARGSFVQGDILARRRSARLVNKSSF